MIGIGLSLTKQRMPQEGFPILANGNLLSSATFTSTDARNLFNESGLLVVDGAAINQPRRTYINGRWYTWFDGQVTELSGRSYDLDNWAAGTAVKDAAGLDGEANSAWTVTDASAIATDAIQENTAIADDSLKRFMAFAVKYNATPSVYPRAKFTLTGGTAKTQSIVIDPSDGTYNAVDTDGAVTVAPMRFGNYWLGVLEVTNNSLGNTTASMILEPAYNADGTVTGDVTAQGSSIFGYCGLFATDFPLHPVFSTGGTGISLGAEIATLTLGNWFSTTAGTLSYGAINYVLKDAYAFDATATERLTSLYAIAGNRAQYGLMHSNSWGVLSNGSISRTPQAHTKNAFAWQTNDFAAYLNGAQDLVDSTLSPPEPTTLKIGRWVWDENYFWGGISDLTYLPTRKPNTYLAAVST